jgi:hypothetical protein
VNEVLAQSEVLSDTMVDGHSHNLAGRVASTRFGGCTHARLLRAFKRRVSGWSSLAGVPEICKV